MIGLGRRIVRCFSAKSAYIALSAGLSSRRNYGAYSRADSPGLGHKYACALGAAGTAAVILAAAPTYAQPVNAPGYPPIMCTSRVVYDASTNGATELVPLAAGKQIYVCGYNILAAGTATVALKYGTGTACATNGVNLTPAYSLTTQVGVADSSPFFRGLVTPAGNALCLVTSAGVAVQAVVFYGQY